MIANSKQAEGLLKYTVKNGNKLHSETIELSEKDTKLNLGLSEIQCEATIAVSARESNSIIKCKQLKSGNVFTVIGSCDTGTDVFFKLSNDDSVKSQLSPVMMINARCTTKEDKT